MTVTLKTDNRRFHIKRKQQHRERHTEIHPDKSNHSDKKRILHNS